MTGRPRHYVRKGAGLLGGLALLGSAWACAPAQDPSDANAARAFASTQQLPFVQAVCGPEGLTIHPFHNAYWDTWAAGFCWAVTDEPTETLQHWADQGYYDRLELATK